MTDKDKAERRKLSLKLDPQRPTPRTDAVAIGIATRASCSAITELARSLERSLSERGEECERLRGKLAELRSKNGKRPCDCSMCDCGNSGDTYTVGSWDGTDWALNELASALSAAEAGGDTSTRSKT